MHKVPWVTLVGCVLVCPIKGLPKEGIFQCKQIGMDFKRRSMTMYQSVRWYSKKHKHASKIWSERQSRDVYAKKAKEESYRCRSAFKLIEINEKYRLFRPGQVVIDCGCAPGSWSQVIVNEINANGQEASSPKGTLIGIDLLNVSPIDGATLLFPYDFTTAETQSKVLDILGQIKTDIVLSDMAPNATGVKSFDHDKIVELCSSVLKFSTVVLKDGGNVLCKIWMGGKQTLLEDAMKRMFSHVKYVKPTSSRTESAEIFVLGRDYKGIK